MKFFKHKKHGEQIYLAIDHYSREVVLDVRYIPGYGEPTLFSLKEKELQEFIEALQEFVPLLKEAIEKKKNEPEEDDE